MSIDDCGEEKTLEYIKEAIETYLAAVEGLAKSKDARQVEVNA